MIELSETARRVAWRFGRRLYCTARGEGANRMAVNGESYVQGRLIAAAGRPLTVFDVGANIGDWTQSLLDQHVSRPEIDLRIFAFDPIPETYKHLAARFRGRQNVTCVEIAMSDAEGRDRMAMASETGGTNTLAFDATLAKSAVGIAEIEKSTVTAFCARNAIERIDLLKCDTEGHDLSVIRGAGGLLESERISLLQFEYNHRWVYSRTFLKDVFDLLAGTPYGLARLRPARIELLADWHPELERFFEANFLIVHERALPWFDVRKGRFDRSNTYA